MSLLDNTEKDLRLKINRPLYDQETVNEEFYYERPKASLKSRWTKLTREINCHSILASILPASSWLKTYKWRSHILADVISGITVAIMHIPQGMAYAFLGNLPPVVGIYMAFFPVLIYFFFGTSRHVSMGTFAIVCLMTGKVVTAYSNQQNHPVLINGTNEVLNNTNESIIYSPMQVATAVTFTVGIIQLVMFFLRLGIISTLLSETLVNGFTTAAAIHVLMSQIKDLLGLKVAKVRTDYFKLVYTTLEIFRVINSPNVTAIIVSIIAIGSIALSDIFLKPWLKKKCNMPLPTELIAVITGTLVSNYCDLPGRYKIETVGNIPVGLPKPELPPLQLFPKVAVDAISITMVSYTITLSMALIFAQKLHYEINSNQELFAMGISNIFGSFFSCMPFSASLSRSLIQQTVGGKTQIASIVSCSILLIILLWIGPFFEPLPRCVLASIIVVALKGMLLQAKQLSRFWKLSKLDGMVWIVTFSSVVLIGIDVGLLFGLITSIASILLLSVRPYTCLLGQVPDTDIYLDKTRYKNTVDLKGIKIFYYCGGINFANRSYFKSRLFDLVSLNPQKELKLRIKRIKADECDSKLNDNDHDNDLHCIIMDLSGLSHIDPSGIDKLYEISHEYSLIDVTIYLANCSNPVYEMIQRYNEYSTDEKHLKVFITLHDAVIFAKDQYQ